ncbi:glycosyltransferase family 2 protein [Armatimonas sp.]|uniref:glycosyltransferase family 2 protein n=1 Tax=Armatimonas sp. TaxID=1872638 RepID=UPI00286C5752|nr:glycosyltransferase family 2 protein [Armatimonas sp.]
MALISLVFPIFNEEAVLPVLIARLEALLPTLELNGDQIEVLFINDGSRDGSLGQLRELVQTRSWVRVLSFSRNFGHQVAVTAGMHHARGAAVVLLDADLQDPPELLPEMIRLWRDEGWEVVYGKRRSREGETAFKLLTAAIFYKTLQRLTSVAIPENTGDFRLMDRKVVDALNTMGEQHRFLRGMAAWVGFKQHALEYDRPARAAGETKYPFRKMFKLAMDAITGFSYAPLKLSRDLGIFIALAAIAYGVVQAARYAIAPNSFEPGWTSIIVVLSLLSGVQLVTLGLIGEYIGRIYDEVKGRPLYLLSEKLGFRDEDPSQSQSTNSRPS